MTSELEERTARAIAYAMPRMIADLPTIFAELPPDEIAPYAYAYFRIADYVINDTWRMCVERYSSLDDAARAFANSSVMACVRAEVARLCIESLAHPQMVDALPRFGVDEERNLVTYDSYAPVTSFGRETRLSWEQDPESNYKGSRAEKELAKLATRLRDEPRPWSRDMCRTMGVTPARARR